MKFFGIERTEKNSSFSNEIKREEFFFVFSHKKKNSFSRSFYRFVCSVRSQYSKQLLWDAWVVRLPAYFKYDCSAVVVDMFRYFRIHTVKEVKKSTRIGWSHFSYKKKTKNRIAWIEYWIASASPIKYVHYIYDMVCTQIVRFAFNFFVFLFFIRFVVVIHHLWGSWTYICSSLKVNQIIRISTSSPLQPLLLLLHSRMRKECKRKSSTKEFR